MVQQQVRRGARVKEVLRLLSALPGNTHLTSDGFILHATRQGWAGGSCEKPDTWVLGDPSTTPVIHVIDERMQLFLEY